MFASLCQLLHRPTLTAKNSRRKEAGLAPGSGIDGSASERQRENCRESLRYKTEWLANGMRGLPNEFSWIWISFLGFSLVHRRYFNVCWPLGLGAFAHFTWSLTKKMLPSCEKYGPSKRKITSWHGVLHSSVKWRSILLSTALWLSFFHFLMPIKCYYVSFKPRKPTVYYIYLLRGELISIVLLGRSNCVQWFHWNVKNGCLSVDSNTSSYGTACRFGHMFSLETGPVLQVEMACCSLEYSLKLQWWNDALIYLISSLPIGWVPWKQIAWHDHARTTLPNPSTIAKRDESHLIGTSAAPKPAWCNSKLNLFHVWVHDTKERGEKTDRTLKTTARFVQSDCIFFHLSQEKVLSTKAHPAHVRAQWFVVAHGWWPEASQEPREEDKAPPGHLPKWNRWNRPSQPGKGWSLPGFPEKVTGTL